MNKYSLKYFFKPGFFYAVAVALSFVLKVFLVSIHKEFVNFPLGIEHCLK